MMDVAAAALASDYRWTWPPPLSPLVIAAVNGGMLRAWSGWMRAVTVYCVAGAAIVYYLVAKLVNKYVLRLEGAAADVYWERRHTRAAPFVVSRLAALGSFYVKLGQYISARADLAPPAWKGFLEALQDDLDADAPRVVRRTVGGLRQEGRGGVCVL